jgi:large subunit ribosomal protein L9
VQVIITKTIAGVGEEGEEMKVKRGYARNFLFPKDYAVYSTPETREKYAEAAAVRFEGCY